MRQSCLAFLLMLAMAAPSEAAQTNAPDAEKTALKVETVATGLAHPWGMAFLPDGRFLVTERPGRLRIVGKDGALSEPVAGVPAVAAMGQGGLLDVALAADFSSSGTIFLSFAEPREKGGRGTSVARARLVIEGDKARLDGLAVIFRQEPAKESSHHFGSRIVLAKDGSLFITLGDRGIARKEAQDPALLIGKVVRILPDGSGHPENPQRQGWDARVWSIGHRNVQGAVLDPATGSLWTAEHGARGGDELNQPQSGKNYGWPVITYGRDYSGDKIGEGTAKDGLEQPVYYWDPSIAVSGLTLYSGGAFPAWTGNFLVGGLNGARVERLVVKDGEVVAREIMLGDLGARIRDVRQGPDGVLYLLTDSPRGSLLRVLPK